MKPWRIISVIFIAFLAASSARAVQDTVLIQGFAFVPDYLTIDQGDSVVWINNDAFPHTSTSDDGLWDSPVLNNGDSYTLGFDSAGTFPYHCAIHLAMTATIEVLPPVVPDVVVDIGDFFFSPAVVQIDPGQIVRWTNTAVTIHTSTAVGGLWDSGDLGQDNSFDYTFSLEGEYDYLCTYHPLSMTGTVIVGTPDSVDAEVAMGDNFFDLDDITVPVGSYVRWINFGAMIHTVTDTTAAYFDSGDMQPGDTFTLYADSVGDFYYLCIYHTVEMTGALHVLDTTSSGPCDYVVGDVNGSDSYNGLDVTYGVNFFKGGPAPAYTCECTAGNTWYVSGDVNQSCSYNGLDITYGVSYFKGGSGPAPCADCPPSP
jgi:plastocyanin